MTFVTGSSPEDDPQFPEPFLNGMGVGVIIADPYSQRISFVNKRCTALLGYTLEEVSACHLSFMDLIHPDDRAVTAAEFERLMRGDIYQYVLDKRHLCKSGDHVWLQSSITLVRDERDQPQACVIAMVEISENRILEQQLAAVKQLAGMIIWSWDVKADWITTTASKNFDFLTGGGGSLASMLLLIHPEERHIVESTITRAAAARTGYSLEFRVITNAGEVRYMRTNATCLLDEVGEVTHIVGASVDVTDVKSRQSADRAPKFIRDILKFIDKNWNKPIYLEEIARQHGVSPRAVQRYFAANGMKPLTKYVKQLRLRHAHQALSAPKARTSVTGVALHCGFQNPGHFSRDYREEFGELPSETLRNALQAADFKD